MCTYGDGLVNPHYDDIVKLVLSEDFGAAVGDIAIVTNMTKIVDFTQPYISTGLVIVAPIRNSDSKHRVNDDFRGPPKRQIITLFLFSMSTLFKTNQEDTVSPLGKMVMVVWLFLLMVITSSYTISLTSILTVQQLPSSTTGVESLIASNLPIQVGSFAYNYVTNSLSISPSRLVCLDTTDYERSMWQGPKDGGVAAIVDELAYVELFMSK
ncbi:PBPe domain-containing protein [Heracleum sosnowskyi]|uniref:PBPe domain-containing protein n=1 Tax=Heracleum sosnowskyi TaxID=360622 RepID=A0AAD8I8E2_9APIA|nr:PBPe domain-containing protein [Heracleum sosnowskyi]